MNLRGYLRSKFGKDLFAHLKNNEIAEERIKLEKHVERISDEMRDLQDKIQRLMLDSKGQPTPMKLLNIQKIKTLRLESTTKQQEANTYIKQLQLLLLVEAMKEHHKTKEKDKLIEKILDADVDHLSQVLFDEDVQKAIQEGRMDDVKDKLKRMFAKEEMPHDQETQELLNAIDDLESVDEETALKMAGQKARKITESQLKKQVREEEDE
ncbi:MAG: hypothetical protein HY518_04915 [Candidatus Aenigmarchaeota archaeon]|nr:hypothetical protein [Candidatus Aenigmarchaeota archaeon]